MKIKSIILIFILFIVAACDPNTIQETPEFELGLPEIAGNGCLESRAHLIQDGKAITIEFEDFEAHAGGVHRKLERKSCALAVPLEVPENYQVAVLPGELLGMADLKSGSNLKVSISAFLSGQEEAVSKKLSLSETGISKFGTGKDFNIQDLKFSKCGESVLIRSNMSLLLKSKNLDAVSKAKIVKFGGESAGAFKLIWKKCD